MDFDGPHTLAMFIVSSLSIVSCGTVLTSFTLFPDLFKKQIHQVIFYIVLSIFLNAFGELMGDPDDGSAACLFQGLDTNIFTLSSITWNVVLDYMMYKIISDDNYTIDSVTHVICWVSLRFKFTYFDTFH